MNANALRYAVPGVFAAIWLASGIGAVSWDHDFRGYVKNYPSISRDGGESDWLNTTRGRLKFRWMPTYSLTFSADYDLSASVGSLLDDAAFRESLRSATAHRELLDMSQVIVSREQVFARHTVDRLYAEYYSDRFILTVGRQRVAWGVSEYFRPLDQFAPFIPEEIDKEERAGIDAVRLNIPWGHLSNIDVIYSPRKDFENERIGVRVRTTAGTWDLSGVAGRFHYGESAGGSFSGSVGGTGVTGEVLAIRDGYVTTVPGVETTQDSYVRATLGASHGFRWRNLTLSGEVYYDGSGAGDTAEYDWHGLRQGMRINLARYYVSGAASVLLSPLVTASFATLANVDDRSFALLPQIVWNARRNADVTLGMRLFSGAAQTEYGAQHNLAFAILAVYF